MAGGRRLWAGLEILDRQLVDRTGRFAGTVDDAELTQTDDGLFLTALFAGPGELLYRLGRRRSGLWLQRFSRWSTPGPADRNRIPLARVADIGSHISVSLEHDEMGTAAMERWTRDHVISHIPGSRHAAE